MKTKFNFVSWLKSGFGSNPSLYKQNIPVSLILFAIVLIVDAVIQFTVPDISIRIISKVVLMFMASWLMVLHYCNGTFWGVVLWFVISLLAEETIIVLIGFTIANPLVNFVIISLLALTTLAATFVVFYIFLTQLFEP